MKVDVEYKSLQPTDNVVQWFWEIMSEMTPKEKSDFLLFVRGSSRLQPTDHLVLTEMRHPKPDACLPTARTCFFELRIARYSSKTLLKQKLFTGMSECQTMNLFE